MMLFRARRLVLTGGLAAPLVAVAALTLPVLPSAVPPALAQDETPAEAGTEADPVVARVDGTEIRLSAVQERFDAMKSSQPHLAALPLSMVFDQLLDSVVDAQVVSAAGRAAGLENDPEVQRRMAEILDRLIGGAYLEQVVTKAVTDEAIQARYDTMKAEFTPEPEIHARHILVETEDEAKDILARLDKGESFEDLAKDLSVGPSGKSGGDLGFFTKERMVAPFAEAAFALEPGQVSPEPVKTEFGWHVIKVEERRDTAFPPLDEMKDEIHGELAGEAVQDHVDALKKDASVELFTIEGKPRDAAEEAADSAAEGETAE